MINEEASENVLCYYRPINLLLYFERCNNNIHISGDVVHEGKTITKDQFINIIHNLTKLQTTRTSLNYNNVNFDIINVIYIHYQKGFSA